MMFASQTGQQVLAHHDSTLDGLAADQASHRLELVGLNEIPVPERSRLAMFARQFQSVLVYVLVAALLLSAVTPFFEEEVVGPGDFLDAAVILVILLTNAILGFIQEYRAESAIAALDTLTPHRARVRRDATERHLPVKQLVPGDIVILEAGDRIPADGRILTSTELWVDEASLTGESVPTSKDMGVVAEDTPLAAQRSMVFAGTLVTRGDAQCVVTATGQGSEIGKIAGMVGATEVPTTPLQRRLTTLSLQLGAVTLALCGLALFIGWWRSTPILEILLVAVSLAVSAVPEGLPAVVTVCFALGVRQMAKSNALVRRLDALETLGSVTVICTDKTGTITENRMTVVDHAPATGVSVDTLATALASCNHAQLPTLGDPTELALLAFAEAQGSQRLSIDEELIAFSSEHKHMATRHGDQIFYKGAPEVILGLCETTDPQVEQWASRGLRVLAAARRSGSDFQYLGLVGLEDPPREGVAEAVLDAARAGVRTLMITGDNKTTAQAIAAKVGISGAAIEGSELDTLDAATLTSQLGETGVFARVTPQHKLRILKALQAQSEVVAMSGDGVNDAPALKGAHVGIAMGDRGTDVARESAAIVLADDHFATIVQAIREGRRIHDNIRKFVLFLLRSNFDELLLVLVALALALPLPLLPIHILWINLLTDGLPALALGREPADPNIMARPPRPVEEDLLTGEAFRVGFAAVLGAAAALGLWAYQLGMGDPLPHARAFLLTFIILLELGMAQSARSRQPLWQYDLGGNPSLLWASGIVFGAHLVLLYTPLSQAFQLQGLSLGDWGMLIPAALVVVGVFELSKLRG